MPYIEYKPVEYQVVQQIELTDSCIKKLADALKQKTGKWIKHEDIPTEYVVCTNCKGIGKSYMDYCWHCGSKNRGDTDEI